jgi:hypothetical protein
VLVSAELRWFWRDTLPRGVEAWFRNGSLPPGGGTARVDEYLLDPEQRELGLKRRGARPGVEVKGLVAVLGETSPPLGGRVQLWCKWTSEGLTIDRLPRLAVHKTRWLRKYDTSGVNLSEVELDAEERRRDSPDAVLERGCQWELVALRVDGDDANWWSVGFEAFGELATVEQSLRRTVAHVAARAPQLDAGVEMSYPAWLASLRYR